MFCPQCRAEYRKGFFRCSGCNIALVDELVPAGTRDTTLTTSRDARFARGYFLYGTVGGLYVIVVGGIVASFVVGFHNVGPFDEWLWPSLAAAALLPMPMFVTGYMLRLKPHWGRRMAFIMAFITFVCAALLLTLQLPKSEIEKVFYESVSLEALNFPGAGVLGLLLGWPYLRNAILHNMGRR